MICIKRRFYDGKYYMKRHVNILNSVLKSIRNKFGHTLGQFSLVFFFSITLSEESITSLCLEIKHNKSSFLCTNFG